MTKDEIKEISKDILDVQIVESENNIANELFLIEVKDIGKVCACLKDVTSGGREQYVPNELRIQIHPSCNNYICDKVQLNETGVILGIYKINNECIFCAFKPEYSHSSTTVSKQIKQVTITDALNFGFAQQVKGRVYACAFNIPFLKFYLLNYSWIHDYPIECLVKKNPIIFDSSLPHPHNRIVFGAPGTGKSFLLNENAKRNFANENIERITFHPNYSYAQFVGTYKPVMESSTQNSLLPEKEAQILEVLRDSSKSAQDKYDQLYPLFNEENSLTRLPILIGLYSDDSFKTKKQDGTDAVNDNTVERNHGRAIRPYVNLAKSQIESEQITYQYVPGPFIRIYSKAKKNPKKNYLLIIEEINRANVAAVFGDVFQLLDRNSDGESEYKIAVSEDIKKYLAKNGIYEDVLSIPSNMYIWATMNSADQGVFPMDTAFKRRWEFEYIGIDDNEGNVQEYEIPINSNKKINWNELRKAINDKLIELSVNEDKLLGPFFLSKNILENAMKDIESFIKLFKSKVIMYLFEDAAKLKVKQLFKIDSSKYIFSEICKQFDEKGLDIFQIDTLEIKISNINDTKKEGSVSEGNSETVSLA